MIEGAEVELYDLEKDPDESDNRAALERDVARELSERLAAVQPAPDWSETRPVGPAEGELLMALGYVVSDNALEGDPFAPGLPDARVRVADVALISEGERLLRRVLAARRAVKPERRVELLGKARGVYEELRRRDPNNPHIPYGLALVEFGSGNCALALPLLERAAELHPFRLPLFTALVQCYREAGRYSDAEQAQAVLASLTEQVLDPD